MRSENTKRRSHAQIRQYPSRDITSPGAQERGDGVAPERCYRDYGDGLLNIIIDDGDASWACWRAETLAVRADQEDICAYRRCGCCRFASCCEVGGVSLQLHTERRGEPLNNNYSMTQLRDGRWAVV